MCGCISASLGIYRYHTCFAQRGSHNNYYQVVFTWMYPVSLQCQSTFVFTMFRRVPVKLQVGVLIFGVVSFVGLGETETPSPEKGKKRWSYPYYRILCCQYEYIQPNRSLGSRLARSPHLRFSRKFPVLLFSRHAGSKLLLHMRVGILAANRSKCDRHRATNSGLSSLKCGLRTSS